MLRTIVLKMRVLTISKLKVRVIDHCQLSASKQALVYTFLKQNHVCCNFEKNSLQRFI